MSDSPYTHSPSSTTPTPIDSHTSTPTSTPKSQIPHLLDALHNQITQLRQLNDVIGTKDDSIIQRRRVNIYSDVSLQLLRQIHMQSSNSTQNRFRYSNEYNRILADFDAISKEIEKKLGKYPEEKLAKSRNDAAVHDYDDVLDSLAEEEQDELVTLLDSFHEAPESSSDTARKWTTWGLLLGGSLLGIAIGGPVGGYAFYAGAGSLGACLGLGIGSGAIAGAGGSLGVKKIRKWAKKRRQRVEEKKRKKEQ